MRNSQRTPGRALRAHRRGVAAPTRTRPGPIAAGLGSYTNPLPSSLGMISTLGSSLTCGSADLGAMAGKARPVLETVHPCGTQLLPQPHHLLITKKHHQLLRTHGPDPGLPLPVGAALSRQLAPAPCRLRTA